MSLESKAQSLEPESRNRSPDILARALLVFGWFLSLLPLFIFFDASQSSESAAPRGKSFLNATETSAKGHKPHGSFSVEILRENSSEAEPGTIYKLKGVVLSRNQATDVSLEWILPKDGSATLTQGTLNETVGALEPGSSHQTSVEITVHSTSNVKIHLNVVGIVNGQKLGGIAQFNTIPPSPEKKSLIQKQSEQKKRIIQ